MPTSSGSHGRVSRPPARYPALEPLPPPVAALPIPLPAVDTAPPETAVADTDPYEKEMFPPGTQQPQSEVPLGFPPRRSVASSEEVIMARFRELEHELRQAVDRLAESEHRLSLVEAEFTRFRDIEHTAAEAMTRCAAVETRLALAERLTTPSNYMKNPTSGIPAERNPFGGQEYISNLPRESVDPQGRHGKVRIGQRDKKRREKVEHSLTSSDHDSGSSSSSEEDSPEGSHPGRGPSVPGMREIVPSRSDYKFLVSYRTYRLENHSPRYDKTITAKLSSYVKRLRHAVEDKFGGDEPIEILSFLRTFKEAADHNDVGEGAAARLLPYFLKDAAKEGYRAHMDDVQSGIPLYPYMVQYLLETYALDDELAKAYLTVSTAKQLEGEDERAFGRRLQRAAIRAGNVVNKRDLKTIYVEGLPPFVQAGLRMHLKPDLTFEEVQRLAQNLGISLRQTMLQPSLVAKPKLPLGVKTLLTRPISVNTVGMSSGSQVDHADQDQEASLHEFEVALTHAHLAQTHARDPSLSMTNRPSWQSTSRSPSPSAASIPTRGWISPGGSVMSEPVHRHRYAGPPRVGNAISVLCFLCYTHGHVLADCPRLPLSLQKEAKNNREAWQLANPLSGTRSGSPVRTVSTRPSPGPPRPNYREKWPPNTDPTVEHVEASVVDSKPSDEVLLSAEAGNESGDN